MGSLPVTTALAGFFALMTVALSAPISLRRLALRVSYGDGGDDVLKRRIRAFGNFIEYAPLALIVLGLLELRHAPSGFVLGIAITLLLARLLHAWGMLYATRAPRALGITIQHLAFLVAGGWLLLGIALQ